MFSLIYFCLWWAICVSTYLFVTVTKWSTLWSSGSTVTVLSSVLCESRTRWRTIRLQSASERGRWTRKASQTTVFTDQTQNFVANDMLCMWTVLPTYNVHISSLLNFTFGLFDWASSYYTLPRHWTSLSLMSFSSPLPSPPTMVQRRNTGHGLIILEVF